MSEVLEFLVPIVPINSTDAATQTSVTQTRQTNYDKTESNKFAANLHDHIRASIGERRNILVLDMHNVADIRGFLDSNLKQKYPGWYIIIMSFVGRSSQQRVNVRADLQGLLVSDSIDLGIMVFARGKNEAVNIFDSFGGKAWVITVLAKLHLDHTLNNLAFFDDSDDHILSSEYAILNSDYAKARNNSVRSVPMPDNANNTKVINFNGLNIILHIFAFDDNSNGEDQTVVDARNYANLVNALDIATA